MRESSVEDGYRWPASSRFSWRLSRYPTLGLRHGPDLVYFPPRILLCWEFPGFSRQHFYAPGTITRREKIQAQSTEPTSTVKVNSPSYNHYWCYSRKCTQRLTKRRVLPRKIRTRHVTSINDIRQEVQIPTSDILITRSPSFGWARLYRLSNLSKKYPYRLFHLGAGA